jgi:transmembrane sensor
MSADECNSVSLASDEDAAAFWVARLHSDQATSADEAAFAAWLLEKPERQVAYAAVERTWRDIGALRNAASLARADLNALRAPPAPANRRNFLLGGSLGLAAAAAAGAALYLSGQGEVFETGVGELRRASLSDGSTISLNTETRVRVQIDDAERRILLDRGQAFFNVAHDPSRPFRVFVGSEEVRALGTAFEVRRVGNRMRVILEEGVVALYRGEASTVLHAETTPDLVLQPGQAAELTPAQIVQVDAVDLRRAGAWRYGQMIFDADASTMAVN